jgi:hypothetical protein
MTSLSGCPGEISGAFFRAGARPTVDCAQASQSCAELDDPLSAVLRDLPAVDCADSAICLVPAASLSNRADHAPRQAACGWEQPLTT